MILSDISLFLQTENLSKKKIAVAVSGGADSVALFFALLSLRKQFYLDLAIVHINYQLRGIHSENECAYVKKIADDNAVESFIQIVPISDADSGLEEKARNIRYSFFKDIIQKHGYDCVAVGHTRDDQAETVLFRLLRGTSVHGASGMEAVRKDGIIRPLLFSDRKLCKEYLQQEGISWFEDASNSESVYKRNLIRNEIMPLLKQVNSGAVKHLAQFGNHCLDITGVMVEEGVALLKKKMLWKESTLFHFRKEKPLTKMELSTIATLLRARNCSFSEKHLIEIERAGDRAGKETLLPGGWRVYSSYSQLIFYHVSSDIFHKFLPFNLESESITIIHGLYAIPHNLIGKTEVSVRPAQKNDTIHVSGKIRSVFKYLIKKGVPSRQRSCFPVLEDVDGTVYIPIM